MSPLHDSAHVSQILIQSTHHMKYVIRCSIDFDVPDGIPFSQWDVNMVLQCKIDYYF